MVRPRFGPSRLLLLTGTWLVGGVVAVSVGFGAVGLVGDEVTERSAAPLSREAVLAALTSRGPTSPPAARPRGSVARSDGASPIPGLTPAPLADPTGSRQPGGAGGPERSTGPAEQTSAGRRLDSYQLVGGEVVVACTGSVITLRYAVPADGYRSVVHRTPTAVEVDFEGPQRSQLRATCRGGAPVGHVNERADDDDIGVSTGDFARPAAGR
jgi:hypothetical protein